MTDRVRPTDLGLNRLLWWFAVLSVVFLGALAAVPIRSHFTEWRAVQQRYNAAAVQVGAPEVEIGIKQIWRPELDRVDRCVSCHLGMGVVTPDPHVPLFAAHPPMPHEPRDLGCTICHGGQGRATSADAAHDANYSDEPLVDRPYYEAACGSCHSGVMMPALLATGQGVLERGACFDCHRVDGKGRGEGPDLSRVGIAGFDAAWHAMHVERGAAMGSGWAAGFAPLAPEEIAEVEEFLKTRIGAPRLVAGKALSLALGCRGCHRINGVGGDEGPDLSNIGGKNPRELDYRGVSGRPTLATWLREHFLDPARVVPQSQMPDLGMSVDQAELLTLYMVSLRQRPIPVAQTPRDRMRATHLGERDFSREGAVVYEAFCAGCHGAAGRGRQITVGGYSFPAIGSAAFLAVADNTLLRASIANGRPGRKMPAWGTKDGGLRPDEIDALVGYLRSLEPTPPSFEEVMAATANVQAGSQLYAGDCAPCHGARGQGTVLAPPLAASDNPATTEDSRVYGTVTVGVAGTAMGSFRNFDATTLRSLVAFVRALPPVAEKRIGWTPRPGDVARGRALFAQACSTCHGERGEGKTGPSLANAAFLSAASDGFLVATIVRGREAMPRFGAPGRDHPVLAPEEVADVVAFVRSLAPVQHR